MGVEILERWEKIYAIPKSDFDTIADRRRRLKAKMIFGTQPNTRGNIHSYLEGTLRDIFLGFAFNDPLTTIAYVPGGLSIPGGPTLLDGNLTLNHTRSCRAKCLTFCITKIPKLFCSK